MAKKLKPPTRPSDTAVEARQRGAFAGDNLQHKRNTLMRSTAQARAPPDDDPADDVYTVAEFCQRHKISPAFYFKISRMGLGPRLLRVGRRTLITREAAAEWRLARQAEANVGGEAAV